MNDDSEAVSSEDDDDQDEEIQLENKIDNRVDGKKRRSYKNDADVDLLMSNLQRSYVMNAKTGRLKLCLTCMICKR